MLIQKRKTSRKMIILWLAIGVVVLLAAFLVCTNFISTPTNPVAKTGKTIQRLAVPKDFGDWLFRDERFNEVSASESLDDVIYTEQIKVDVMSSDNIPSPTNVQVTNPGYGGKLILSWAPPVLPDEKNVSGFEIARGTGSGGDLSTIAFVDGKETGYADTTVINGATYSYAVKAVNYVELRSVSNVTIGTSKSTVSAQPVADGGVLIAWSNPQDAKAVAVQIIRVQNGIPTTLKIFVDGRFEDADAFGSQPQFFDETIASGTNISDITYTVKWFTEFSESAFSESQSGVSSDIQAPQAPSNVTVKNIGDGNSVLVSWSNPVDPDFHHIRIYRSTGQGTISDANIIKDEQAPTLLDGATCQAPAGDQSQAGEGNCYIDDSNLIDGLVYYYTLTSIDTQGNESPRRVLSPVGKQDPF